MGGDGCQRELVERRRWYLERVVDTFRELRLSNRDGRAWSLNHARLALARELEEANRYFESAELTRDRDFAGIRLLKTLLDFQESPRLSSKAKQHLRLFFVNWQMKENSRVARWPAIHTENHDLMELTIGMFAELFRGRSVEGHIRELSKSLRWRFQRGWIEWNSPRYQQHYLNPLLVLAEYAPSETLREGAKRLFWAQLAERAVLSVRGYLGGPFLRGWDRHPLREADGRLVQRGACAYFDNNRYDAYLPTMWLAFGLAEPYFDYSGEEGLEPAGEGYGCGGDARLNQDEGMFFASSSLAPHPVLMALAEESSSRPCLIYRGTRPNGYPPDPLWEGHGPSQIYYYNTPHISMGSLQWFGWSHQTRYCSVMFAQEPSKNLRIELILPGVKWDRWRHERRGELVQHRNWLIARGKLVEDGGIKPRIFGVWNIYRVGKGLAAHIALGEHQVIQVSDLEKYRSEEEFVRALRVPEKEAEMVTGRTTDGDIVRVDLRDMSIWVNEEKRRGWTDKLHDSEPMYSAYGSGVIQIRTKNGRLRLDDSPLE